MLKHLLVYDLKIILKDSAGFLFGMLFPFVFGLIYLFTFQGLVDESFELEPIPVGLVDGGERLTSDILFSQVGVEAELQEGELRFLPEELGNKLLVLYPGDEEETKRLADGGILDLVIMVEADEQERQLSLYVPNRMVDDLSTDIVYSIIDQMNIYSQSIIQAIDSSILHPLEIMQLGFNHEWVEDLPGKKNVDGFTSYYFAALAYVCLFFMNSGHHVIRTNRPSASTTALRLSSTPMPQGKIIFAYFIDIAVISLLVIYSLVIVYRWQGVSLGNDVPRLILILSLGSLVGILLGTSLAALLDVQENTLIAISTFIPLLLGAAAGMMTPELTKFLDTMMPWFRKVNPVSLISDALYYLNYYPSNKQFNQNAMILGLQVLLFGAITLLGVRRSNYESL